MEINSANNVLAENMSVGSGRDEQGLSNYTDNQKFTYTASKHGPQGDIDLFENMFEAWKNQEMSVEAMEKDNTCQQSYSEKDKNITEQRVTDMAKTIDLLQKSLDSLHNELDWVAKVEQDKRSLTNELNLLQKKLQEKEEELQQTCLNYETKLEKSQTESRQLLENIRTEANKELQQKEIERQKQATENQQMIEGLHKKLVQAEKEKTAELAALTVEYDDKLAKLRVKAVSSHNQPQTTSNQEIFRKKLQHLKSEYEQEARSLRDQVKSLQNQISARQCLVAQSGQPSVMPVSTFPKRARKF